MYYDENYGDPRQYCRHGSFIGSWWGPDYLCGQCESSEDDPSLNEMIGGIYDRIHEQKIRRDAVSDFFREMARMGDVPSHYVQSYLYLLNVIEDRISSILEEKNDLVEMYSPFCDEEEGYDDHSILWKYHRHCLNEYEKEMKEWAQ